MKIEVEVTKEVHELGLAFKKIIVAYHAAKADGWDTLQDLPAVVLAAIPDLMAGLQGIEKSGAEFKEAPIKAALGALVPIAEGIELLVKKDEPKAE